MRCSTGFLRTYYKTEWIQAIVRCAGRLVAPLALTLNMAGAATLEVDRSEFDVGDPITIRFVLNRGDVAREIGLFRSDLRTELDGGTPRQAIA